MRAIGLVILALLATACASKPERTSYMTPGSRLIYHGGKFGVWTTCDRGNRVYYTETGLFQVVAGGCPDGSP